MWVEETELRDDFCIHQFTLGMHHYYGAFDVVHARSTANGVRPA